MTPNFAFGRGLPSGSMAMPFPTLPFSAALTPVVKPSTSLALPMAFLSYYARLATGFKSITGTSIIWLGPGSTGTPADDASFLGFEFVLVCFLNLGEVGVAWLADG